MRNGEMKRGPDPRLWAPREAPACSDSLPAPVSEGGGGARLPRPGRGGAGRRCRRGGAGGHHGLALVVAVRRLLPPGAATRLPAVPPPARVRAPQPAADPQRGGECGAAAGAWRSPGMNGAAGVPSGAHGSGGHSCSASGPPRPLAFSPTCPLPGKREGPRAVPVCEGWRRAGSSLLGEGAACEG